MASIKITLDMPPSLKDSIADIKSQLAQVLHNQGVIMTTQAELAAELSALKAQVDKVRAEVTEKVQSLEDALNAAGTVSPEVEAALADLKASVQAADDLNPDPQP